MSLVKNRSSEDSQIYEVRDKYQSTNGLGKLTSDDICSFIVVLRGNINGNVKLLKLVCS